MDGSCKDLSSRAGLDSAFEDAIESSVEGAQRVGLLYSGGLDSSLLAWTLKGRIPLELVAMGLPGARDLVAAESGARALGLPTTIRVLNLKELEIASERFAEEIRPLREPQRSVALAFALALSQVESTRVICGQGADELFFGYAHFAGLSETELRQLRETDLRRLLGEDWPRAERFAASYGKELRAPYLDERFVAAVRALPISALVPRHETKPFLRRWAMDRGLPEEVARRAKRAMQYGSGVRAALRRKERTPSIIAD